MRAAFAVWDQRIAPVFDVTRCLHIVETQAGRVVGEHDEVLSERLPAQRALRLVELGIDVLICGAVSRSMLALVASYGVGVQAFVAGELADVRDAWIDGRLDSPAYAMPGCRRRAGRGCSGDGATGARGRGRGRRGCRTNGEERS